MNWGYGQQLFPLLNGRVGPGPVSFLSALLSSVPQQDTVLLSLFLPPSVHAWPLSCAMARPSPRSR